MGEDLAPPCKWRTMALRLLAVTEESSLGTKRLYEMQVEYRGGKEGAFGRCERQRPPYGWHMTNGSVWLL